MAELSVEERGRLAPGAVNNALGNGKATWPRAVSSCWWLPAEQVIAEVDARRVRTDPAQSIANTIDHLPNTNGADRMAADEIYGRRHRATRGWAAAW